MSPMSYGLTAVKLKNYIVYLAPSGTTLSAAIAVFRAAGIAPSAAQWATLVAAFTTANGGSTAHIGECRKDSIDLAISNGDTVEGNEVGQIVMNKQGTLSVELINCTPGNINVLETTFEGKACSVALRAVDASDSSAGVADLACSAIIIDNVVLAVAEKYTGGDVIRATLTLEKKVPTSTDFRSYHDIVLTAAGTLPTI